MTYRFYSTSADATLIVNQLTLRLRIGLINTSGVKIYTPRTGIWAYHIVVFYLLWSSHRFLLNACEQFTHYIQFTSLTLTEYNITRIVCIPSVGMSFGKLCPHWLKWSPYLNQCWFVVNCTHGYRCRWNVNQNATFFCIKKLLIRKFNLQMGQFCFAPNMSKPDISPPILGS